MEPSKTFQLVNPVGAVLTCEGSWSIDPRCLLIPANHHKEKIRAEVVSTSSKGSSLNMSKSSRDYRVCKEAMEDVKKI